MSVLIADVLNYIQFKYTEDAHLSCKYIYDDWYANNKARLDQLLNNIQEVKQQITSICTEDVANYVIEHEMRASIPAFLGGHIVRYNYYPIKVGLAWKAFEKSFEYNSIYKVKLDLDLQKVNAIERILQDAQKYPALYFEEVPRWKELFRSSNATSKTRSRKSKFTEQERELILSYLPDITTLCLDTIRWVNESK